MGIASVANSLCREKEKHTMCEPEAKIRKFQVQSPEGLLISDETNPVRLRTDFSVAYFYRRAQRSEIWIRQN
jgi:hypothetical protein